MNPANQAVLDEDKLCMTIDSLRSTVSLVESALGDHAQGAGNPVSLETLANVLNGCQTHIDTLETLALDAHNRAQIAAAGHKGGAQ